MYKNNIMNKLLYSLSFILLFSFWGCNNVLDILPDDKPSMEDAFKDAFHAEKYLFTCYSYIPQANDPINTLGLTGGGEIMYSEYDKGVIADGLTSSMLAFVNGNNTANPLMNFWDGMNGGQNLWQGIRHCNNFLNKISIENGGPKDLEETLRARWIAEVKTIKAYLHFYLFRLYGPIPIIDETINFSGSDDNVYVHRNPVDEVANYIATTLDEAIVDLPTVNEMDVVSEFGRFNKTIALSIKAKALVWAASPLFSNNNYYAGFADKRGIELFPSGDNQARWERALDACDIACRSAENDGATIFLTDDAGDGAIRDIQVYNIGDTLKAMVSLRQAVTKSWNSEVIWADNRYSQIQQFASMLSTDEWINMGGTSGSTLGQRHGPTINFVERFYSSNGIPINEDREWLENNWYTNRYATKTPDSKHSKYFIKEGQETALLHHNRSMRFYASVGFDGGLWEGREKRLAETSFCGFLRGQGCGMKATGYGRFSPTGYLAKKLSHLKTSYAETRLVFRRERYSFPIIRLADMYLLLAECLNEAGGPEKTDSQGLNAYFYLNQIRARSGMEGVVESWNKYAADTYKSKPSNKSGLRDIIRQERINELAFEGHYYYDIRRWLLAENHLSEPVLGWNVMDGFSKSEFYNLNVLAQPKFTMKDYLMPIRTNSLLQNQNLVQNPGW